MKNPVRSLIHNIIQINILTCFLAFLFILIFHQYVPQTSYAASQKDLADVMECIEGYIRNNNHDKLSLPLKVVYEQCSKQTKIKTVDPKRPRLNQVKLSGDQRFKHDKRSAKKPFTLTAHNPTYFLIGAYNEIGYDETTFHESGSSVNFQENETQFQISFKSLVFESFYFDFPYVDFPTFDLYVGYTNRSFWQLYNKPFSSPFREYNHEPEVWLQFYPDKPILGLRLTELRTGFSHQSNGQGDPLSRSWNRVYANFIFETEKLLLSIKPWLRVAENSDDDNNPDISDYMGHAELRLAYLIENPNVDCIFDVLPDYLGGNLELRDLTLSLMSRNNIESGFSRGAIELGASFSLGITENFKFYIQYFSGYGESLIDYDNYVNRIGFGLLLNDWL